MAKANSRAVLVTTAHRGVFFGLLSGKPERASVVLRGARNCIYWSADVGGFAGLASKGPTSGCKLGSMVDSITLYDITSIADCTGAAREAWESHK